MDQATWNTSGADWMSPEFVSSFHDQMMGDKEQYNPFPEQSPPSQLSYGSGLSSLSSPSISSPQSPQMGNEAAYPARTTPSAPSSRGAKNNSVDPPAPTGDLWNDYLAWDLDPSSTNQPWDLTLDNVPTAGLDPSIGQPWQRPSVTEAQPLMTNSSYSSSSVPLELTMTNYFVSPSSTSGNEMFGSPASSSSLNISAVSATDPNVLGLGNSQSTQTNTKIQPSFLSNDSVEQGSSNFPFSTWPLGDDNLDGSSNSSSPLPVKKEKTQSPPHIPKTTPAVSFKSGKQRSQTAHKAVEKRYRTNLNAKIAELRDCIPSLRASNSTERDGVDDADDARGANNAQNFKKGVVLAKAAEYIQSLEDRNKTLDDQVALLQRRLNALQKIALAKTAQVNPRALPEDQYDVNSTSPPNYGINSQTALQNASLENQVKRREANSAALSASVKAGRPTGISKSNPDAPRRNGRSAGTMSKLMMGGLAGLTMMQGLQEGEQSGTSFNARGLFALPTQFITSVVQNLGLQRYLSSISSGPLTPHMLLASFRALLVFGAMLYIFIPSIFDARPKDESKKQTSTRAGLARSSVSSSLEARRAAWLTAIQTVWVPSNSIASEFTALGLKTTKVLLRKLIGWETYFYWTGMTEDDEIARVAAWDTAIESQLAGGDAEISLRHLLLTLIASTTLPETPGRLLLRALHLQLLLKEAVVAGYGRSFRLEVLATKVAQHYWLRARKLQQARKDDSSLPENHLSSQSLPDHLGELLNQEFETVFVGPVIQRGYLLAWNKPLSRDMVAADEGMDQVVEDVEIRTPLDALAAWWSSLTLRKALLKTLEKQKSGDSNRLVNRQIMLALKTAPPASGAEMRALAAQAVFTNSDEERKNLIDRAITAVPFKGSRGDETPREHGAKSIFIKPKMSSFCTLNVRLALRCSISIVLGEDEQAWQCRSLSREKLLESLVLSLGVEDVSLLGFASTYRFLQRLFEDRKLVAEMSEEIEQLAAASRLLVGSSWSQQRGLSSQTVASCVETCLEICKQVSGARSDGSEDEGYASLGRSPDN